ncbi:MAG: hypothetical protein KC620_02600 [Myxococcales bacterium]|nr:hypothetical protein [Myxococcales bacterium]
MARLHLASALFVLGVASGAHAQSLDSPRGMAMGGVRADPVASSAVVYNPAGMARAYLYAAEVQYFRLGPDDVNVVGVNVVDSKTQPSLAVGAAYGYHFSDDDAPVDIKGHDARLAFAHPLVQNQVNAGVSLRYVDISRKSGGVDNGVDGFTLDAGLLISLSGAFHLGAIGQNLVHIDDPAMPRRAGGGIAYTGEPLVLDVDVLADFDTHEDGTKAVVSAGGELLLADTVPIRAGYEYDGAREQQWVSGGVGFVTSGEGGQAGQISISYKQNLDHSDQFGFGIGLMLFL